MFVPVQEQVIDLPREVVLSGTGARGESFQVDFDPLQRSLKAQMKQADRLGAPFVCILGEGRGQVRTVALKSMRRVAEDCPAAVSWRVLLRRPRQMSSMEPSVLTTSGSKKDRVLRGLRAADAGKK